MRTTKHDWKTITAAFVEDGLDEREIAETFAAPYSTVRRVSIRRDWAGQRRAWLEKTRDRVMERVADKLLGRIEQTLDGSGSLDVKDLKAVTGALKELREWQSERPREAAGDGTLTVRFLGQTEEMSQ